MTSFHVWLFLHTLVSMGLGWSLCVAAQKRMPTPPKCDDFTQECAGGIHFYITKLEAEND